MSRSSPYKKDRAQRRLHGEDVFGNKIRVSNHTNWRDTQATYGSGRKISKNNDGFQVPFNVPPPGYNNTQDSGPFYVPPNSRDIWRTSQESKGNKLVLQEPNTFRSSRGASGMNGCGLSVNTNQDQGWGARRGSFSRPRTPQEESRNLSVTMIQQGASDFNDHSKTIFTHVGSVPKMFKLPEGELERLIHADSEEMQNAILERFARNLPTHNRTIGGGVRYCEKCKHIKPDRAHHCSVCGKCILKMDHHCPWVNNCVCFNNYKYFILFLAYALTYCSFISVTSIQYFIAFWKGHHASPDQTVSPSLDGMIRFHILFLFFVAVLFAISLASLFFYHLYLVSVNRTTLEAFRAPVFILGPDKNGFNLGNAKNFKEVFGNDPKLWMFPIFTSLGDGASFAIRHTSEDNEELLNEVDYEESESDH